MQLGSGLRALQRLQHEAATERDRARILRSIRIRRFESNLNDVLCLVPEVRRCSCFQYCSCSRALGRRREGNQNPAPNSAALFLSATRRLFYVPLRACATGLTGHFLEPTRTAGEGGGRGERGEKALQPGLAAPRLLQVPLHHGSRSTFATRGGAYGHCRGALLTH